MRAFFTLPKYCFPEETTVKPDNPIQLKCTAKSYLVQSIRTEQTTTFFVKFLFDATVLHHFEDLMELTPVYSIEQSRGDSF